MSWEPPQQGGWARNFRYGEWLGEPLTPLFETWLLPHLEAGLWRGLERLTGMPRPRPSYLVVNGWYYATLNFWPSSIPAVLARIARHPRLLRVLFQFVPGMADRAVRPWIPAWRTALDGYRALVSAEAGRVETAAAAELVEAIDRLGGTAGEYFAWVALLAGAGYKTELPLAEFYARHLAGAIGGSHLELLGSGDPALAQQPYAVHSLDWVVPTLGETGAAPVAGPVPSLGAAQRSAAAERARAALAGRPRLRRQLDGLLATAQRYATLREEIVTAFTLPWPVLRRAALRLGERLAQPGVLAVADDVFSLTREEVDRTLSWADAPPPGAAESLRARIDERRQRREAQRRLVPPTRLGTPPAFLAQGFDRMEQAFAASGREGARTTADGAAPARPGQDPRRLHGLPASAGVATGPVRVIRAPQEFGRLLAGDVLVAPATAPAWTPLFARAVAVVTDTGSPIAHASLVAREYGLPAVVAVEGATARLRDGQRVTVNGSAGTVDILE